MIDFLLPLLHWSNSSFLLPVKYCGGWLFNATNALFGVAFWRCKLAELWKSSLDLIYAFPPEVCGFYIGWTLACLSPPLPLCRLDNEHPRKKSWYSKCSSCATCKNLIDVVRLLVLCFSFWWEYRNHSWPGNHPELEGSWFNVIYNTHIFQPSWCRHGWPWDNICQWDLLSTGDETFLSMYCWYVVPEPLKWVEIFRRCYLHQCYFEVCNQKFLKPTLKT